MGGAIIGLHDWFETPPGRYLLGWETARYEAAVGDVFGYHALQLGLPEVDTLAANRMPHRWRAAAVPGPSVDAVFDFAALPFPEHSLDLVCLPHTLELHPDPHSTLREVERVLVPEGRAVFCGFNPASLWGLRQRRAHLWRRLGRGELYLPAEGEFIAYRRLRDWLRLLGFEVESAQFGCWRPAVRSERWLQRTAWMDTAGDRWWPIFGAVYVIVAVKRVRGMRLMGQPWRAQPRLAGAPVPVARHGTSRGEAASTSSNP